MAYRLLAHRWPQAVGRDEKGVPLTIVDRRKGDIIDDIADDDLARLLTIGAIEEVGAEVGVEDAADDGAESAPQPPEGTTSAPSGAAAAVARPAQTATKEAWEAYAVSRGLTAADAAKASKQDLIATLS